MLKHYGVTPVMVFDGGLLPSKMGTEDERERCAPRLGRQELGYRAVCLFLTYCAYRRRSDAFAKGNAFRAEGKGAQARECYVKAVDVTPAMAYQLIKVRRDGA